MTIVSFASRRRRVLLFCVASVLLHLLTIGWVGARIGLPQPAIHPQPVTIVAQLRAPPAPALAPVPVPAAAVPPRPRKRPAPRSPASTPAAPAAPAPAAALASAPAPSAVVEDSAPAADLAAGQASASVAEADVESARAPAPAQAAAQGAAEAPSAPLPAPGIKAQVPPSAELTLDVTRTDAGGVTREGAGSMAWTTDGASYSLKVEAGVSMVVTRLNLLVLASEGSVGEDGFAPRLFTEKRLGRSATATHFNRDAGTITFSATSASFPLAPGVQDKATLPLQLAAIARADRQQLERGIDITVGEDKEATLFHFELAGREDVDTGLGSIEAWHLTRPPRPGVYSSRLDVWLAPGQGWLPVRIRNTEANGAVTTQTVSKIVFTGSGS